MMRVSNAPAARTTASLATAGARAAFRLPAERAVTVSRTTRAGPVLDITGAGPVDEVGERRRRLVRKGRALLDALDGLKLALLSGRAGAPEIRRLARDVQDDSLSGDAGLDDILAGIRLRAAVELAKSEAKRV